MRGHGARAGRPQRDRRSARETASGLRRAARRHRARRAVAARSLHRAADLVVERRRRVVGRSRARRLACCPPRISDVRTSSAPGQAAARRSFRLGAAVLGDGRPGSCSTYGEPLRPSKTTSVERCTSRAPPWRRQLRRCVRRRRSSARLRASCRYAVWMTTVGRSCWKSRRTACASRTSTRSTLLAGASRTSSRPRTGRAGDVNHAVARRCRSQRTVSISPVTARAIANASSSPFRGSSSNWEPPT